jgi:hypothetical protein
MSSAAIIVVSGIIPGWFSEKAGGIFRVIVSLAFIIWSYIETGHNKWFAFFISGSPYLITGKIFLISFPAY